MHVTAGLRGDRGRARTSACTCAQVVCAGKLSHITCKTRSSSLRCPLFSSQASFEWQANPSKLTRLSSRLPEADLTLSLLRASARVCAHFVPETHNKTLSYKVNLILPSSSSSCCGPTIGPPRLQKRCFDLKRFLICVVASDQSRRVLCRDSHGLFVQTEFSS